MSTLGLVYGWGVLHVAPVVPVAHKKMTMVLMDTEDLICSFLADFRF